jgi:hypothetical protein
VFFDFILRASPQFSTISDIGEVEGGGRLFADAFFFGSFFGVKAKVLNDRGSLVGIYFTELQIPELPDDLMQLIRFVHEGEFVECNVHASAQFHFSR